LCGLQTVVRDIWVDATIDWVEVKKIGRPLLLYIQVMFTLNWMFRHKAAVDVAVKHRPRLFQCSVTSATKFGAKFGANPAALPIGVSFLF